MQTKTIAGVARWVLAAVLISGMPGRVRAQGDTALSAEDERAYQAALASWKHFAEINEEVGLPPLGNEPQREDFVGFTKAQQDAAVAQAAARPEAEARWQQRLEELRPILRVPTHAVGGDRGVNPRKTRAILEKRNLLEFAEQRRQDRHAVEQALDQLARQAGVPRIRELSPGRKVVFSGLMGGQAVWLQDDGLIAGSSTGADELWPQAATPWTTPSTGLDLTGSGVLLGMWEVGGAVRETHGEYQNRVLQADDTDPQNPIALSDHACGVAGAMAAGGAFVFDNFNDSINPFMGPHMRGVAYEADVDAYDTDEFAFELPAAAAGDIETPGLRLANNSWGFVSGWRNEDIYFYDAQTNLYVLPDVWRWYGDQDPACFEDYKFGYYTPSRLDGAGSVNLDAFMASVAPRTLLVYSGGNDRFTGPRTVNDYFYVLGDTNQNGRLDDHEILFFNDPPENQRDWASGDGDVGGYDSLSPPHGAKNVLTVGAVEDVFHMVGQDIEWGIGPGANVTLAMFSGCGPTDDGRIKPDIVAVGARNPVAREFGLILPGSGADDAVYTIPVQGGAVLPEGTSFAAPGVSGGIALAMQSRLQLFPTLDPEVDDLLGSTWKCLVIHTAVDMGQPGPDFQMGYGLFNARSMVEQLELDATDGRGTHIREFELAVGQTAEWIVSTDGGQPLRATIAWSDPAGPADTSYVPDPPQSMLINNLDLHIETVGGTQQFLPWILDPDLANEDEAVRVLPASTGVDDRNNVEQVVLANPAPGDYRIVVTHSGGIAGNPAPSPQWVSVVTSGDTVPPPAFTDVESAPAGAEFVLHCGCGPGEYLVLESTASLTDPQTWGEVELFATEAGSNAVQVTSTGGTGLWRLRRQ
jgi:hypothetical protein